MIGDGPVVTEAQSTAWNTVDVIRDSGLEWAPVIVGIIGSIFLVGLTLHLIRRGLARTRDTIRL